MRRTPAFRTALLALLGGLAAFQLVGLITVLVSASRERVTDFGIYGPGLGGRRQLNHIRAVGGLPVDSAVGPALEAGLKPGDVITHIDGTNMSKRPGVWYRGRFTTPPGASLRLDLRRDGATFDTVLRTRRLIEPLRWSVGPGPAGPYMDYRVAHWWVWGPQVLMSFLLFAVGLFIGIVRRDDPTAWIFALVFIGISLATSISADLPLLHVWPPWLLLVWNLGSCIGTSYSMPLAILGLGQFPVPTRLSRRFWPWRWVPFALIGGVGVAVMAVVIVAASGTVSLATLAPIAALVDLAFNAALALGFIVMGALLFAHRFERYGPADGRLRLLWNGAMAAVVGGLWAILIPQEFWHWLMRPLGNAGAWLGEFLSDMAPALLASLLPLSFAYAILARRLFGIRFVIRRGLQHLLLSRGVLVVEGVVLFLVLEQSIRRRAALAGMQGPALAGVLALLVVSGIALVNRPLMQSLDRRFFRDRYDARRVLLGLGQDLGRLRERDEILRRTGEAIVAALHPARVGIFLRDVDGRRLRTAWRSDSDSTSGGEAAEAPADLEHKEALLNQRLSVAGEDRVWHETEPPPVAGERSGPNGGVALADASPNRPPPYELGIQLRQSARIAGCIALAAKRSEEPYTAEDRELLVTVAHQAALALENAELLSAARHDAQLTRDVEIARQVQKNLFPRELPDIPGWEVAAVCLPARAVAGDYYDVVRSVDGDLGVSLGDVSGKGIGASLLSAGVHAMVRSRLPGRTCDLGVLLQNLNAHLLESSADEMFAMFVVARITPADGRMMYVNGGHPPPLLIGARGARWLDEGGPLVGVIRDARYLPGETRLEPGDLFAIYSDGVTEAERPSGEMFGPERLLAALMQVRGAGAEAAPAAVLRAVEEFTGGGEPADDISVVVVRGAG